MTEMNTKETKIVKATPKKQDSKGDEPRVTVKAAVIPARNTASAAPKTAQTAAQAQAKPQTGARRQFIGTPVVNKDLENRTSRIPRGMTPVAKEVTDKAIEVKAQEQAKAETPETVKVKEVPRRLLRPRLQRKLLPRKLPPRSKLKLRIRLK